MKRFILLITVLLAGCHQMSFDEVIKAERWCNEHGLFPNRNRNFLRRGGPEHVYSVTCQDSSGSIFEIPSDK